MTGVQQISLKELFDNKLFCIPNYQRGYSWGAKQRKDLFEDILSIQPLLHEPLYKHYMGTVVAIGPSEALNRFQIVDGQQRLTSLILLVHCLLKREEVKNSEDLRTTYLVRDNDYVFQSGLQQGVLNKCLDGDFDDLTSRASFSDNFLKQDLNIIDAIDEFDVHIRSALTKGFSVKDLVSLISDRLGFILFVPKVNAVVGRMFEVINNRGKDLSELDKIKNYLVYLGEAESHRILITQVETGWGELLANIQLAGFDTTADENEFLRACWLAFNEYSKGESQAVYESLKKKVTDPINGVNHAAEFYKFLRGAASNLAALFSARERKGESSDEIVLYERLSHQLRIVRAAVLPLILSIMAVGKNRKLELLSLVEKLNFRFYLVGIPSRSDSGQVSLFRMAHSFYHSANPEAEPSDFLTENQLAEELLSFIREKSPDEVMVKSLIYDFASPYNFYGWQSLRYFLARFECHLVDRRKSQELSRLLSKRDNRKSLDHYQREHLWAESYEPSSKPKRSLNELEEYNKCRLGNFTLLTHDHNSKVGKLAITRKVEKYRGFHGYRALPKIIELYDSAMEQDFARMQGQDVLAYTSFLDMLETTYVNFALSEWGVDGSSTVIIKTLDVETELNRSFSERVVFTNNIISN